MLLQTHRFVSTLGDVLEIDKVGCFAIFDQEFGLVIEMFGFYLADINVIVVIVYLSMILDNILLTVVVPILPDYLYWLENFNVPHLNITKSAQDSNDITLEQSEVLGNENGKVGILLASKALIQILINPLIGVLTQYVGYNVIMFVGSVNLLIATLYPKNPREGINPSSKNKNTEKGTLQCTTETKTNYFPNNVYVPTATTMSGLIGPHLGLGLGIGILDSALVPLLASVVDSRHTAHYGSIYALQQTAVSLAYSLGPLLGGELVKAMGFTWLMRCVGFINIIYCPVLILLSPNIGISKRLGFTDPIVSYSATELSHKPCSKPHVEHYQRFYDPEDSD
ncbi:chromaffin granule amine transporter-like [Diaphorina citri]|uniref:Chromaffin granule amine transporter-like n=1 Tax=Diaphorina citri TaxID=121845 RepID=A0A1S4EHJ3_DIACI|nr:chromaffin granule amine transporter-like [Diaphorina citri]